MKKISEVCDPVIRQVELENGLVKGLPANDPRITVYKGIPFADKPIHENRFRAPMPCPNWQEPLEAYAFQAISVQDTPGIGDDLYTREWHVDSKIAMSEDCLYLNIWTNAKSETDCKPVLIWFFGGAFQWGYPSEMEFNGERIARRDVILVTVNYRLNVFGFLAHPELTKEQSDAPTNFGLLDQKAGIEWVKSNIHKFGGDPNNITIAGQSAGAAAVLTHTVTPQNTGLFQKAIMMSGMFHEVCEHELIQVPPTLTEAEKNGEAFFKFLGIKSLEEARALDAFYIRDQYCEYAKTNKRMAINMDQNYCNGNPIHLFRKNKQLQIPMLFGNTDREFLLNDSEKEKLGLQLKEPLSIIEYTILDAIKRCEMNGNQKDHFYYRFEEEIPGEGSGEAFHSVDLWFFFETLSHCSRPYEGKHYDLSRIMCNYLTNFVKHANPNGYDHDDKEMKDWLPYKQELPFEMCFHSKQSFIKRGGI